MTSPKYFQSGNGRFTILSFSSNCCSKCEELSTFLLKSIAKTSHTALPTFISIYILITVALLHTVVAKQVVAQQHFRTGNFPGKPFLNSYRGRVCPRTDPGIVGVCRAVNERSPAWG